jgi:hypothetical protein
MITIRTGLPLGLLLALAPLAGVSGADLSKPGAAPAAQVCVPHHAGRHGLGPMASPVQDYEPRPAMWRLSDADTTITILGTYHVLPEGFRWRTPLLDTVIAGAEEVVFESRDDEAAPEAELTPDDLRFFTLMIERRSAVPLSERVAPRNRDKLVRLIELAGLSLEEAERMPPMMTMFAIAAATSQAEGSLREFGVETVIEEEFKASGRPISAIEDPIAVVKALLALDEAQMIAMIDEGLDEWDGCALVEPAQTDWSSEHNWAQGKLEEISVTEMKEEPFGEAMYQVLLVDRNRAWTDWVAARMEQPGNLLLAVGAGHMEGPDSLITMLDTRGLKVERIQ